MLAIREHLVHALRYDLIGPMRPDEILEQRPSRWYLAGFLVPTGTPPEAVADATNEEERDLSPDAAAEDDRGDPASTGRKAWFPSSFGLSVLLPSEESPLLATVRWGQYRRLTPIETAEAWQKFRPAVYQRRYGGSSPQPNVVEPPVAAPEAATEGNDAEEEKSRTPPPLWARSDHHSGPFVIQLTDKPQPVPGAPGLSLKVELRPALSPGLDWSVQIVSVFLVNERELVPGPTADTQAIFQVELELHAPEGFVARTSFHQQDSEEWEPRRADLQYRDHGEWAVGHGVSATPLEEGKQVYRVATTWLPQAKVYRMKAGEVGAVPLQMERLAALPNAAALRAAVQPMLQEYLAWIAKNRLAAAKLDSNRAEAAGLLMDEAEAARLHIAEGLARVEQDPLCWEAFRLCNLAMAQTARQARPGYYEGGKSPEWRLFQLAFLLLNIPSMADPNHPLRGRVELLFFPTGGGKTEAYLGVAAFAMILRRLRGVNEVHEGAGVAVLLRYTLRMLTLDQLGRAATLICALELLRRQDPTRLGQRRFQIGLWVGSSATPNRMEDAEQQLSAYRANPDDRRKALPMPVSVCPWCQSPFEQREQQRGRSRNAGMPAPTFAIRLEGGEKVLRVGCISDDCHFHFDNSDDLGVPIVVVDQQVYRELPAFLIATVDKFAGLPRMGQAGMLFGRVRGKNATGFAMEPGPGLTPLPRLLPPELILQDELHLISGPLGTMVGLYETVVDALCRQDGARPKLIASTATARGAVAQVQALWGRELALFPPQGIGPDDSFFAASDRRPETSRLYVGVAAPGRNIKAIEVRVYSALLSAAYKEWRRRPAEKNPADTYMTLLGYFNSLRELGGATRLVQEEVGPRAARLADRRPFQESENTIFMNRSLSFEPLELTSRRSTDEIRVATGQLRAPYQSPLGGRNDVVLASSMISVGVDIPRLGLMVMDGQPKTVAEYIQATSRVGRETPGLVVTLLNLRRPRDRSHYERFVCFHQSFYRLVEASSVTPFSSRALDRGLAGVTVALARHLYRDLQAPRAAGSLDRVEGIQARLRALLRERIAGSGEQVPEALLRAVEDRVTGLLNDWSRIAAAQQLEGGLVYSRWEVKNGVELLPGPLDVLPLGDRRRAFVAPSSLRDVEETVALWAVEDL
jgi:Helicase conserved C-terminal domain